MVNYKGFKQAESVGITLHPYFLKQYNSRWFLFGYNENEKKISNLALDRVIEIKELDKGYIENDMVDFDEYFEDVVGVTVKADQAPVKVMLQINKNLWPYIESKPIHGSQKIKSNNGDLVTIELSLQINYELTSLIFSLGEGVKVIEPIELKEAIKAKTEAIFKNYL
jgi:predicted DNA-binding transcriptional regulator YafY